jgi:hypothetical protein
MTPQVAALLEIARYLEARKVPYATIGGIAAAVWGLLWKVRSPWIPH